MQVQFGQDKLDKIRLHHVIDMGLAFSAMMRVFEPGSKEKLHREVFAIAKKVFEVEHQENFDQIHAEFCKRMQIELNASYGQIAKTLNVVLKVVVYYCHFPDYEKSKALSKLLHAAVDRGMMAKLKRYSQDKQNWPTAIEEVGTQLKYEVLRQTVAKPIRQEYNDTIYPVEFDDIEFGKGKYSYD